MRLMLDFECNDCGNLVERFIDKDETAIPCECGGVMRRLISMPQVKLEGITGSFPGAHDRWARIREDHARIKARKNQ